MPKRQKLPKVPRRKRAEKLKWALLARNHCINSHEPEHQFHESLPPFQLTYMRRMQQIVTHSRPDLTSCENNECLKKIIEKCKPKPIEAYNYYEKCYAKVSLEAEVSTRSRRFHHKRAASKKSDDSNGESSDEDMAENCLFIKSGCVMCHFFGYNPIFRTFIFDMFTCQNTDDKYNYLSAVSKQLKTVRDERHAPFPKKVNAKSPNDEIVYEHDYCKMYNLHPSHKYIYIYDDNYVYNIIQGYYKITYEEGNKKNMVATYFSFNNHFSVDKKIIVDYNNENSNCKHNFNQTNKKELKKLLVSKLTNKFIAANQKHLSYQVYSIDFKSLYIIDDDTSPENKPAFFMFIVNGDEGIEMKYYCRVTNCFNEKNQNNDGIDFIDEQSQLDEMQEILKEYSFYSSDDEDGTIIIDVKNEDDFKEGAVANTNLYLEHSETGLINELHRKLKMEFIQKLREQFVAIMACTNQGAESLAAKIRENTNHIYLLEDNPWTLFEENLFHFMKEMFDFCCPISQIIGSKTCQQVYHFAKRYRLNIATNHLEGFMKNKDEKRNVFTYTACKHPNLPCNNNCPCVKANIYCEKYCDCDLQCENRFPGCSCVRNCNKKTCPCFAASRECHPFKCESCVTLTNVRKYTANIPCRNMNIQLGLHKHIHVSLKKDPYVSIILTSSVKKNHFITEYCGEIISLTEANKRRKVYDKDKSSLLLNLNPKLVIDINKLGNRIQFFSQPKNANCYAKSIMVNGDHRIGLYALRNILVGEELIISHTIHTKNECFNYLNINGVEF